MAKQKYFISCKDYLVSGEEFDLFWNDKYEILETKPIPLKLPFYYSSDHYISHTDSKSTLTEKLYQRVKNFMLNKKLDWIYNYKTTGKLLDVGAGTGDFLIEAKNRSFDVYGVEPNEKARGVALHKDVILEKEFKDLKELKFDVITLWHVLEHIPDQEEELKALYNLLADDGILVVAVPNFKSYDANYYKDYWAAYDVPRHLYHYSQKGITDFFYDHNFELVEKRPLIFDSYYVSLLSEKHKTGSSNYLKAFYTGLKSNIKARSSSEYSSLVYFFKKEKI
ncbi:class I SAM-dependent methyltransferase [Salegentibacter sp. F188]|uniref:Class I SAM-dependent methyltransferase n=1 Tax=Autumnicola patrickiae TaxID=3075591 RepID=A0ABU3E0U1_9FLAO|nr:class I SAM-dependent methyltransferase [Salegentibacter sp. F188]MDT0689615.1 class I SAM-dependent methyltransferase [Salegentibacter sp. F188]